MKPTTILLSLGVLIMLSAATWWTIDSVRYGAPVFYSRESKHIITTETDPVFGTEVTVSTYQHGPFMGLLDAAFPFGLLPAFLIGAGLVGASRLQRYRAFKHATAMLLMVVAVGTASAATSLKGVPPGKRTVMLNEAVRKSEVRFESDAPLETIVGSASNVKGTFHIDPSALEETTGSFSVEVRSMKTGMSKRDDHMLSDDWLDAKSYPEITYEVEGLKNIKVLSTAGGKTTVQAVAFGTFSMHGVSRKLEANVTLTYVTANDETRKRASGDLVMIEAEFTVPWKQHGVKGRKSFNDKVSSEIKVDVSLYGNTGA